MVNNGSLHYDHDMDGTHTQLGGEHTGCEAKFRNKQYQTQLMIRYVGDVLSVRLFFCFENYFSVVYDRRIQHDKIQKK